ncbi:hypothetical protein [Natrinema sp. DC36]|uniref:hypothetical protein n=1 Tax=Natrinema sp. DC36 TaxID=2878680 RepID=UPI001CF0BD64|nr:hypothetical protein [Natrinema sp. DC36]
MQQRTDTGSNGEHGIETSRVTRRSTLIGVGTMAATGLAGCSARANERLEDVAVFNETDEPIDGTIDIIGPDDEIALSDAFDVASHDEEADVDSNASASYEGVWGTIGDYDVSVQLADGFDIDGKTRANETVTIEDTDSALLAVVLGSDDRDDEIGFAVGERWTDFER